MKARRRSVWKLIVGLLIICFLLEEGLWFFTPKIANYFGMAWPGGLPDHINYSGHAYTNPSSCLPEEQAKQLNLVQVGTLPTLFGAAHPLLVPQAQSHSSAAGIYVQSEIGCYVLYKS